MMKILIIFLNSLFNGYMVLYCSSKIINKKIDYKKFDFWICLFCLVLYTTISYILTDSLVRVLIYYILLSVLNLILFKSNVLRSVVASLITMMLVFISEIIFMLVLSTTMAKNIEVIRNHFFGSFISNSMIVIMVFVIISIPPIRNFFQKIIKNIHYKGNKTILVYSVFSLTALTILLYYIYFEVNMFTASILCLILVVTFSFLTLYLFKEKNANQKLQIEYDLLSENLAEYEKMYQLQRMLNHENKNDLSTIRALAQKEYKNNKELISYIDELIDLKVSKNEKWMDILKLIPEPTLRGLLYYKFSTMQHKGIMIETDMSKQVTIKKFKNISYDLNKKVCKILGIYLDNAIQAVENLDDRHIKVSIYLDVCDPDILVISVMNNYKGFIEMDRLEEKGYSTKGKGRGLGLAIAKEILENEPKLDNQTKIIKNNFVQELKVML